MARVSSQFDLIHHQDFIIEATDLDLPATGLERRSHVSHNWAVRVPVERIQAQCGEIVGEMRDRFQHWCGD